MNEAMILVGLIVLVGLVWLAWFWRWSSSAPVLEKAKEKVERSLRIRTPEDCPACSRAEAKSSGSTGQRREVRPWSEVKSRRGAPKRVKTEGYACPNRECEYYGITDEAVHALVGYGGHGRTERIQDLRCQACRTKVTERWATPLYRLKTSVKRIGEVLTALGEGLDVSTAVRVFGHGEGTIRTWLTRTGLHAERGHAHFFRDLLLEQVQLDELRTKVRRKARELWVWVGLDVGTKIIPVLKLGPRTQVIAYEVIHELAERLAEGCLPLFPSDGLDHYFYALTAHFGQWKQAVGQRKRRWEVKSGLWYGQVKKVYQRRRLVRVEYRMRLGQLTELTAKLRKLKLGRVLNTAFVERVNLTLRQGIPALIRRTWSTAQEQGELALHLEWWRGYYHFIRVHEALRVELAQPLERRGKPQRYCSRTPAMAARLTDHRWTVKEFLRLPMPPASV